MSWPVIKGQGLDLQGQGLEKVITQGQEPKLQGHGHWNYKNRQITKVACVSDYKFAIPV